MYYPRSRYSLHFEVYNFKTTPDLERCICFTANLRNIINVPYTEITQPWTTKECTPNEGVSKSCKTKKKENKY